MFPLTITRSTFARTRTQLSLLTRHFTLKNVASAANLPPRMVINEEDLEEKYLKGSGPGGQKIVGRLPHEVSS